MRTLISVLLISGGLHPLLILGQSKNLLAVADRTCVVSDVAGIFCWPLSQGSRAEAGIVFQQLSLDTELASIVVSDTHLCVQTSEIKEER